MEGICNENNIYEEDCQYGKYLTFLLGDEVYGIEIKNVTEIIGIQKINQVPDLPNYMKGIINLRGKIIPVIDVRLKFKKEPIEYDEVTCIVVVNIGEISVGLIVDNVNEVLSIADNDIVPSPSIKTGFESRYIKGISKAGSQAQLLLDCEMLINSEEIEGIKGIV